MRYQAVYTTQGSVTPDRQSLSAGNPYCWNGTQKGDDPPHPNEGPLKDRRARRDERLRQFAARRAQGLSPKAAAEAIGMAPRTGSTYERLRLAALEAAP